ncbi:MAG: PEP-CTERM sorting domain-containing protein [Phycisphaerales bacterium]
MRVQTVLITTAVGVASSAALAGPVNLLSNAGFESQVNFDGNNVGNWAAFFGGADFQMSESIVPVDPPVDGLQVLQTGTFNTPNTFVGVVQSVSIQEGMEYEFSLFAREIVQNGIFAEFRIEWLDSGGVFIGDQFALNMSITDALVTDWTQFSVSGLAPSGAVTANAVFAVQTFGSADPYEGFVQVDGTSFHKVPAPGTLALLAVGAIAAPRRRR